MAREELQHSNQSRRGRERILLVQLGWLGFAVAVDGGTAVQTQQQTNKSIRKESQSSL
jgi:hypothetical protein